MFHLNIDTVGREPLATPLPVVFLIPDRSTRPLSLPIGLLKPLGPEAAILQVDDGVDFERVGVDDDVMLCQIIVTEDVTPLLDIGLRPPASVLLPESGVHSVGSTQQFLTWHAGGVGSESFECGNMLEQLLGDHLLLLLGEPGHGDPRHEFCTELEGTIVLKGVLKSWERDVCPFPEILQDGSVRLPSLRQAGGWCPVGDRLTCHPFVPPKGALDKRTSHLVVFFIWSNAKAAWLAVLLYILVGHHFRMWMMRRQRNCVR